MMTGDLIQTFILLNTAGDVRQLMEELYDDRVLVISNGVVFAENRQQAYAKQKPYIDRTKKASISLLSQSAVKSDDRGIESVELVFAYQFENMDGSENAFTGRHVLDWQHGKIVKEQFSTQ